MYKLIYMNTDLQLKALEEAVSYPPYKQEDGVFTMEVDEFNYNTIFETIKENSNEIAELEGEKLNLITDILKVLCHNQQRYNVQKVNYFVFFAPIEPCERRFVK